MTQKLYNKQPSKFNHCYYMGECTNQISLKYFEKKDCFKFTKK